MNLRYTSQAQIDIDIAMDWYKTQRKGLEFEFLDCIEVTITKIIQNPELYSVKHKKLRGALIRRFPFTVFYTFEKNEIVVHAVFGNKQNPTKLP